MKDMDSCRKPSMVVVMGDYSRLMENLWRGDEDSSGRLSAKCGFNATPGMRACRRFGAASAKGEVGLGFLSFSTHAEHAEADGRD